MSVIKTAQNAPQKPGPPIYFPVLLFSSYPFIFHHRACSTHTTPRVKNLPPLACSLVAALRFFSATFTITISTISRWLSGPLLIPSPGRRLLPLHLRYVHYHYDEHLYRWNWRWMGIQYFKHGWCNDIRSPVDRLPFCPRLLGIFRIGGSAI